jgi:uncharacterized membrane protein YkvA (DUF1232 family)
MEIMLGLVAALVLAWFVLILGLWTARPHGAALTDFLRLLPDVLRLFRGLLRDPMVPFAAKARLWLLLGYLAMPIDLVPDFIPVLGYADDAIIAAIVLRSVIRRAGEQKVREHWPGTADGLRSLLSAIGVG